MASWMVHLRVAQNLLAEMPDLSERDFIMGNIAPDSGVPNSDWTSFSPSTNVSHFKSENKKADPARFAAKYFTDEKVRSYRKEEYAFFLGYLVHLVTDVLWSKRIAVPTLEKFGMMESPERKALILKAKEDWYDLDFKYLQEHPDFHSFQVYTSCEGYRNTFMEEFSEDAFDNRRIYITGFYSEKKSNLEREYHYLKEAEMDHFVKDASKDILKILTTDFIVSI